MSKLTEEEIEQIARIVAAATKKESDEEPPRGKLVQIGSFFLNHWPLTLVLLTAISFLGAIAYEGASPLYYFKKIAAEDRQVTGELAMHAYREDLTTRHLEVGYALLDQGLQDDALTEFTAAKEISKDSIPVALAIRTAELFKEDAFQEYNPAVFKTRVLSLFGEEKQTGKSHGDIAQSHYVGRQVLSRREVRDPHVLAYLGDFYRFSGDDETAASTYRSALKTRPTLAQAEMGLGHIAYDSGDYSSAETHYRRAHELFPDNPDYVANLASTLRLASKHDEAIEYFLKAIALDPDRLAPIVELCLSLRATEKFVESYNALARTRETLLIEENSRRLFTPGGKNDGGWLIVIEGVDATLSSHEEKVAFLNFSAGLSAALIDRLGEARALVQGSLLGPGVPKRILALMQAEIAFLEREVPASGFKLAKFRSLVAEVRSKKDTTSSID